MNSRLRLEFPKQEDLDALRYEAERLPLEELQSRVKRYEDYQKQVNNSGFFRQFIEFLLPSSPMVLDAHLLDAPIGYSVALRVLDERLSRVS